jgi:signal transduction histidine kinase
VAAIQSGRLRLSPSANDAAAIAREAVTVALPEAQRRELLLHLDLTEAPSLGVRCDRGRIVQVLSNLLSNAFHATERGGAVTVRVKESSAGAVFSVKDTGRGLPPGPTESLFEPYQRGPNPGYKGAGLGLAIARGIVEGHGGRIWAETPDEGGASFCIELPRA